MISVEFALNVIFALQIIFLVYLVYKLIKFSSLRAVLFSRGREEHENKTGVEG